MPHPLAINRSQKDLKGMARLGAGGAAAAALPVVLKSYLNLSEVQRELTLW